MELGREQCTILRTPAKGYWYDLCSFLGEAVEEGRSMTVKAIDISGVAGLNARKLKLTKFVAEVFIQRATGR